MLLLWIQFISSVICSERPFNLQFKDDKTLGLSTFTASRLEASEFCILHGGSFVDFSSKMDDNSEENYFICEFK